MCTTRVKGGDLHPTARNYTCRTARRRSTVSTPTVSAVRGVTLRGEPVNYINELEWIDDRIWANVYTTDYVMIINPETGVVEGVVDFSGLLPAEDTFDDTDVFNGIAYDAATGRIFVTGKRWNKLFEVEIVKR